MKKGFLRILSVLLVILIFLPAVCFACQNNPSCYTYKEMEKELKKIHSQYPDNTKLTTLGQTIDGREIYCLKISDSQFIKKTEDESAIPSLLSDDSEIIAPNNIFIFGAIHAREYVSCDLVMNQIKNFLKRSYVDKGEYKNVSYSNLMKDTAIYVVPMSNPDGVSIAQFGLDGINKPEVKEIVKSVAKNDGQNPNMDYFKSWKANAQGVDINKQFDALWDKCNSKSYPSFSDYKGKAIGETVEAKSLIDLTNKIGFDRTISYHCQGQVIYWYFMQKGDLLNESKSMAQAISNLTGYRLIPPGQSRAGYKDWVVYKKQIPSLTIEIGLGPMNKPMPASQYPSIFSKNNFVWEETLFNYRFGPYSKAKTLDDVKNIPTEKPVEKPVENYQVDIDYSVPLPAVSMFNSENGDVNMFTKLHPRFAIGANSEGYPVFKSPALALDKMYELYGDTIKSIAEKYNLGHISRDNVQDYIQYAQEIDPSLNKDLDIVIKFLDIYQNSFFGQRVLFDE